jgi:hypothetical protein
MKPGERSFIVRPGRFRDTLVAVYKAAEAMLTQGPLQIVVKLYVPPRSDPQNNALFGVAYPPLMDHMGLRGEAEKLELHEYFCGEFFGWVEYEILGKKKQRPKRTTTKNEDGKRDVIGKLLFAEFYDFVQHRAALHGVVVPDPDPQWFIEREPKRAANDQQQAKAA